MVLWRLTSQQMPIREVRHYFLSCLIVIHHQLSINQSELSEANTAVQEFIAHTFAYPNPHFGPSLIKSMPAERGNSFEYSACWTLSAALPNTCHKRRILLIVGNPKLTYAQRTVGICTQYFLLSKEIAQAGVRNGEDSRVQVTFPNSFPPLNVAW
jgi:hypothetical protein